MKPLLAGLQVFFEWPVGWVDAFGTLREDLAQTTFEINTVGWPLRPAAVVQELRCRWIAAGGQPSSAKGRS